MQGKQHVIGRSLGHCRRVKLAQRPDIHCRAVNDFTGLQGDVRFQRGNVPVGGHKFDGRRPGRRGSNGLLAAKKIPVGHMANPRFGHFRPILHHLMGIALAMFLDRCGRPPIRVPFPDHRVDRAAQHPGIARLDFPFCVRRRLVGVVGNIVPLVLQLRDGAL